MGRSPVAGIEKRTADPGRTPNILGPCIFGTLGGGGVSISGVPWPESPTRDVSPDGGCAAAISNVSPRQEIRNADRTFFIVGPSCGVCPGTTADGNAVSSGPWFGHWKHFCRQASTRQILEVPVSIRLSRIARYGFTGNAISSLPENVPATGVIDIANVSIMSALNFKPSGSL